MTQREINDWAGSLGDREDLEVRQNVQANFNDLYGNLNLLVKGYADEPAAARDGVPYGALYHVSGTVKVRILHLFYPVVGSLTLTGAAPRIINLHTRTPTVGSLTLSGVAPRVNAQISPPAGALSINGLAPQIT